MKPAVARVYDKFYDQERIDDYGIVEILASSENFRRNWPELCRKFKLTTSYIQSLHSRYLNDPDQMTKVVLEELFDKWNMVGHPITIKELAQQMFNCEIEDCLAELNNYCALQYGYLAIDLSYEESYEAAACPRDIAEQPKNVLLPFEEGSWRQISIKENERHILSYEHVFGEYLNDDVRHVLFEDPWFKENFQLQNLSEFTHLLLLKCDNLESIKVITSNKYFTYGSIDSWKVKRENQRQRMQQLQGECEKKRVKFTVEYSQKIHDRKLEFDKNLLFILGRGLDYFYNETNPRRCKQCTITILKREKNALAHTTRKRISTRSLIGSLVAVGITSYFVHTVIHGQPQWALELKDKLITVVNYCQTFLPDPELPSVNPNHTLLERIVTTRS